MTSKTNPGANKVPLQTSKPLIAYGRMRRWLGMLYVGLLVSTAMAALKLDLPRALFSTTRQGFGSLALELATALTVFALVSLPLDSIGFYIEQRYKKSKSTYRFFLGKQIAAYFRHGAIILIMAILIALVNRYFGLPGLALWSVIVTSMLLSGQLRLARFYAGLSASTVDSSSMFQGRATVLAVPTTECCFTGGIIGLPSQEKIVIPEHWLNELPQQQLETLLLRRQEVIRSGLRTKGILIAALFTCSGILMAGTLTERYFSLAVDSAAGLVTMSLLFTLWSFTGLISLPSITHLAVYEADKLAVQTGVKDSLLRQVICRVDEDMGEESSRTAAVDNIFHPVPTAARRLEALNQPRQMENPLAAWQTARYALFLSVAGLGLLGGAVHCNAGKPVLWAMMPAD
ncbi:MAG: hypothetical protein SFV17_12540 [Candidatus Obscuribacter sp.]|nr:hypothetical protein [Candidatus Obscuribacter sp.]